METLAIPAGFDRHYRQSPLTDPWEPLYSRKTDGAVVLGLEVTKAHTNSRGFVHGGLISALADNAMGLSCGHRLGDGARLVTVNLTLDFLASAQIGQWLEFDTIFVKPGGSLCFAQAFVTADGEPCARANAVFKVMKTVN
ncbi:MAG: PaaI family thioesterase [Phenylobacterium sp.]|uniref:PaaI family thioesterase n=1 Tax=Phenylobacterium sp. TaxID=1871053 RepID=UPI001B5E9F82|nr:PaaI family thioesterase [Phenylobacterium sp.]MBP7650087.1 PaaI family thioesterase [Phenylobacterium sp.]MBP7816005.1 PaaI family thioesterase [Phenylobacterium sp.]MBP9232086.1 PaaI family thioesterase [Phenylobacterium sp.]MBP9755544.1 PaaI family thioesterase [Phenylobacterium sp.]